MTSMDCKICRNALPDLLLDAEAVTPGVSEHVAACADCRRELDDLRATMALMDDWTAPEPSAFFDSRLHARLREAQDAPAEGLWERLSSFLTFSTGRGLRPAMAGALGVAMLLGGGTAATYLIHHSMGPIASPTVNDLKIYDNNAQAVQQMDLLDETNTDDPPQS